MNTSRFPILGFLAAMVLIAMPQFDASAGASSSKQSRVIVRFHPQTGDHGGEFSLATKLQHSGRPTFMGTMPLINERDIVSAYPFETADGTWGVYFKLDAHGSNLIGQHSASQRGTFLFAYFNGRHVMDLYIDRPVSDGIIAIPSGLTAEEVDLVKASFPPIGKEGQKPAKIKKPKPSPTPAAESR